MATPVSTQAPLPALPRQRSTSRSPDRGAVEALPPVPNPLPPPPPTPDDAPVLDPQVSRRGSFGFLKRGKSVERSNSRKNAPGAKLTKRQVKEAQLAAQREAAALSKEPPQIPGLTKPAPLQSFDGASDPKPSENHYPSYTRPKDGRTTPYGVPIPPIPDKHRFIDPYDRGFSITNRSRSSYASSMISTINSPRRVRKRNDPTPFK